MVLPRRNTEEGRLHVKSKDLEQCFLRCEYICRVNMHVHWGWYVQICGVSYGENIRYLLSKCSPHNFLLELYLTRSELRAIHPYHPATKAGFGEEVSVVEGLGCIIGRLFSLLAIDWSCLGLAADQSLFIRSRKRL